MTDQPNIKAPTIHLFDQEIDIQVAHLLPEELVTKYRAMPFDFTDMVLSVAMVHPNNLEAIDEIELITGYPVKVFQASEEEIHQTIQKFFKLEAKTRQSLVDMRMEDLKTSKNENLEPIEAAEREENQPIVKLMNQIVQGAINARASDIHLEPQDSDMRVRYRIDGVLHDAMMIPHHIASAITSRSKIFANMDITEKRRPQDGHASLKYLNKPYDLRVSSLPTVRGEKIVIRILDKSNSMVGLDFIGLTPREESLLTDMIAKPYGMILVTGPTGSGKSTTLYSVLNHLNKPSENIMTIEDPVELKLEGINQVQANSQAGVTFASALKAFLRQDPNIIMVGEIRDTETAEIATQAALTGHLVLSTLHTNDAASAVTRLIDMGLEPFLVGSTLIGVIAQRLARKTCVKCKGKGCVFCYQKGMKGRTGIFEILNISESIQKLITNRAAAVEIRKQAMKEGMKTIVMCGQEKVKQGLCTQEEINRIVGQDY